MKLITCPHCNYKHLVTSKGLSDVVVVLPCPSCHDLMVLFRGKITGLKRDVLEHGTFEEQKQHIAEIVMEYLEPGMFKGIPSQQAERAENGDWEGGEFEEIDAGEEREPADPAEMAAPITQSEVDQFVRLDLHRIDEASYFHKHFG